MKRSLLVAVFLLVFALTSSVAGAANIEIISQTYTGSIAGVPPKPLLIEGISNYLDGLGATYAVNDYGELGYFFGDIVSHQPIRMDDWYFAGYGFDAAAELINPYTLQVQADAIFGISWHGTSDIVFSPVGSSYLDISLFVHGMMFGDYKLKLIDTATNAELLNMSGGGYIPPTGIQISNLFIPVTPSGIYEFILVADDYKDSVWVTSIIRVPEPGSLFLIGSGLLGLVAGRKSFKQTAAR